MATLAELREYEKSVDNNISTLKSYQNNSKYDQTKVNNALTEQYDYQKQLEDAKSSEINKIVQVHRVDLPNYKDRGEWLGGGTYRNSSFAGGDTYTPVSTPSFDNKKKDSDIGSYLLSGNFLFLNSGFNFIQYAMSGYELNFALQNEQEVYVFEYEIVVTNKETNTIIHSSSGSVSSDMMESSNSTPMDITSLANAFKNQSVLSPLMFSDKFLFSLTIIDRLSREDLTIEENISSMVLGTINSQIYSMIASKVVDSFNITVSTFGQFMGLHTVLYGIYNEAVEVMLGLDNSFGFGGDFVGEHNGTAIYSESKGFMGLDTLGKSLSVSLGLTDKATYEFTDKDGNVLDGYSMTSYNKTNETFEGQSTWDSMFGGFGSQDVYTGFEPSTTTFDVVDSVGFDNDFASLQSEIDNGFGSEIESDGGFFDSVVDSVSDWLSSDYGDNGGKAPSGISQDAWDAHTGGGSYGGLSGDAASAAGFGGDDDGGC